MLIGALLLVTGATLVGVAWERSPLRRVRRRLAGLGRRIRRALGRSEKAMRSREDALARAAGEYAARWRAARRQETPIEALRDAGARGVRLGPLREAGYRTVGDLDRVDRAALERVPGVGRASAKRVLDAARAVRRRIDQEPVALPEADLERPAARPLAAAALDVLEGRDVLGNVPRELVHLDRPLGEHRVRVEAEDGFLRWLLRKEGDGVVSPVHEAAAAAARRAEAVLESGLLEDLRQRRERLRALPTMGRGPKALVQDFRNRYADAVAVIESVLPQVAHAPGAAPDVAGPLTGRLPSEIAAAVEAFPLVTDGLDVTLRRYQVFGTKYLLHQRRTVLGDEMGLGKTIQALAAMVHRRARDGATHFLVVAPASITGNWLREIDRRTDLAPHLLHGPDRDDDLSGWLARGGVGVVSYTTLRTMGLDRALADAGRRLDVLVADEAHYVKNPESGRARALTAVLGHADHVCLMTGTPMENHPGEFRRLVGLVAPGVARTLGGSGVVADEAVVEPAAFHRAIAPVYLRRNQRDVLRELPPKVDFEEWVDPGPGERGAYRDAVIAGNVMAMRRAVTASTGAVPSSKMQRLEEIMDEHRASGRKVLVFSYFLPVLEELARRFDAIGAITGDVPSPARMEIVDRFHEAEGHAVLLGQIRAAGVGLNLHAASAVVLMEPQWKPSTEEQAIARAHRMGQTETVLVHRLLARDSVDERIVEILEGKLDLFEVYARESLVKRASRQATEPALAELVVEAERARLGASDRRPARSGSGD